MLKNLHSVRDDQAVSADLTSEDNSPVNKQPEISQPMQKRVVKTLSKHQQGDQLMMIPSMESGCFNFNFESNTNYDRGSKGNEIQRQAAMMEKQEVVKKSQLQRNLINEQQTRGRHHSIINDILPAETQQEISKLQQKLNKLSNHTSHKDSQ